MTDKNPNNVVDFMKYKIEQTGNVAEDFINSIFDGDIEFSYDIIDDSSSLPPGIFDDSIILGYGNHTHGGGLGQYEDMDFEEEYEMEKLKVSQRDDVIADLAASLEELQEYIEVLEGIIKKGQKND